jgi:hypothetical protein
MSRAFAVATAVLVSAVSLAPTPVFGTLVRTNVSGLAPMNTETDATAAGRGPWFYRVQVE